jgi:hypothetical protein
MLFGKSGAYSFSADGLPGAYTHTDHTDSSTDQAVKKITQYSRSDPRYDFTASVNVVDLKSGKQVVSTTSNLSRSGCHVRTSAPFQQGAKVKVTISHLGTTFESDAEVVYAIPGAGMGLHFDSDETTEQEALGVWLDMVRRAAITISGEGVGG